MNSSRPHIRVYGLRPRSLAGQILFVIAGAALLVLGFFFLTIAIVAGALLALVILARWWWLTRKLARKRTEGVFEGEYKIVERTESREK
jgi:hypothetical protein